MKHCSKCGRAKPLEAFANHTRDGKQNWCKTCMTREGTRSRQQPARRRIRSTQEHKRVQMLTYGLTSDEYDTIMGDRLCEVCGSGVAITLDHNHKTGKPRGRLCRKCNFALGHALDNPAILRGLADYIERTN